MDELTPWWTVVGFYPNTQRYCEYFQAASWQVAEDMARLEARNVYGVELKVCATFPGEIHTADTARFIDPDATEPPE